MGSTTRERGWVFPEFVEGDRFLLEGEGVYHPFLENPVGNPTHVTGGQPVVFLTGPNMAGKTTYMKALGIATAVANAPHTGREQGVGHRDVKPGNILMSRGEPLIADSRARRGGPVSCCAAGMDSR